MRVLIDHSLPFLLAHGGVQLQIEQTRAALAQVGVEAHFLQWWDERQPVDLIHYFSAPHPFYLSLAQWRKIPVVATSMQSAACNRPRWRVRLQGWIVRALLASPAGRAIKDQIHWTSYRQVTHNVVGLEIEREVLRMVYRVPEDRVSVVPLGLSDEFLAPRPAARGTGPLVCAGAITPQKNSIPLARLAREARVPVLFIGRPYAEDEYWREFMGLVDGVHVLHQPFVEDRATMVKLLDSSRGAVAVSDFENWCLTAHEAAARGLPLLLRRQRWSMERFGEQARFFDEWGTASAPAVLRKFHEDCPSLPAPQVRLHSWREVAEMLKAIYERVLSNSR